MHFYSTRTLCWKVTYGVGRTLAKVSFLEVPVASTLDTVRDLGVVIDSHLSLSAQVAAVCRCVHYQLWQLRPLFRSMSAEAVKTLVQAIISCSLDYCNSLFYGIAEGCNRGSPTL